VSLLNITKAELDRAVDLQIPKSNLAIFMSSANQVTFKKKSDTSNLRSLHGSNFAYHAHLLVVPQQQAIIGARCNDLDGVRNVVGGTSVLEYLGWFQGNYLKNWPGVSLHTSLLNFGFYAECFHYEV